MFLGTHTPRLDEKGRLILPAKFREDLADGLVIVSAPDHCLAIWPTAVFFQRSEALSNASSADVDVRRRQRLLAAGANPQVPDKQGRITISLKLREWAGLDKECVVIGAMNRVEVWDAERWSAYSEAQESAFAAMDEAGFPGL